MARDRRQRRPAAPVAENNLLADWERELMGLPPLRGQKPKQRTRAEIRQWDRRAMRLSGRTAKAEAARKRTPKTVVKPKTAEAAEVARRNAKVHKQGKFTRTGELRKSRRALKRELHPKRED